MTDTNDRAASPTVSDASLEADQPSEAEGAGAPSPGLRVSRLGNVHAGLIVAAAVLVVLLVFILENAHSVDVGFIGAHVRLPLAVALLLAGVGGALLVGAIGAARIAQLRRAVRHEVHRYDQRH